MSTTLFSGCLIGTVGTLPKPHTQKSVLDVVTANGGNIRKPLKLADPNVTHIIAGPNKAASVLEALEGRRTTTTTTTHCLKVTWVIESVSQGSKVDEADHSWSKKDFEEVEEEEAQVEDEPAPPVQAPAVEAKAKGKRKRSPSPDPEPTPAKMVKVVQKGSCPVDTRCPLKGQVHVQEDGEAHYDAMLNQTEIGKNANKFYVIQVLKDDHRDVFYTFNVWGRVGENGQNKMSEPMSQASAVSEFRKKFREKTKLDWSNKNGAPLPGKYTYLERSYEEDEDGDEEEVVGPTGKTPKSIVKKQKVDHEEVASKLDQSTQGLIAMIFNLQFLNQTLSTFEYDASKLPLGKLAKSTMEKGFLVLKEIAAVLQDGTLAQRAYHKGLQDCFEDLTNRYYTLIPHAFGRNKPPLIMSEKSLKRELDLIEALGDLKITSELMSKGDAQNGANGGESIHQLDRQFNALGLRKLETVQKATQEYTTLEKLLTATSGATHNLKLSIVDAFKVEREDLDAFNSAGHHKGGERRLLWHGSRSSNYGGILNQGLRIAPPEAPASGYMFGKGIYLASISSKSANYCYAELSNKEGLLMLCEAQVGKPLYEREHFEYEAAESCAKGGFKATWGIGQNQPSSWVDASALSPELKGVKMPSPHAPPKAVNRTSSLIYDEFIVYDKSQVVIRYLLRVKFDYGYSMY